MLDLTTPSICLRVAPVLVDGYNSPPTLVPTHPSEIELQVNYFNYGPTTKIDQDESCKGRSRRVEEPRVHKRKLHEAPAYSLLTCHQSGTGHRERQGMPNEDQASRQDQDPGTNLALQYA